MSSTQTSSEQQVAKTPSVGAAEMKLEVVVLPVSDVDRAKRFYGGLGWRLDADFATSADFRVVQLTPPGSQCSVIFGKGITTAEPGSIRDLMLVVHDIEEARAHLLGCGVDVSASFHDEGGVFHHAGTKGRVPGPEPTGRSYGTWASFSDPDGNGWLLQEVKTRLPGRLWPDPVAPERMTNVVTLTELLREAEEHHGDYEATAPKHHWSGWYAAYMVARGQGRASEQAANDAALHIEGERQ